MPVITFEGEDHPFPDNFTDEHIAKALKIIHAENLQKQQDKLTSGLSGPAQPKPPGELDSTGPLAYAQSRNETAQKYLKSLMNFTLGSAGGGISGQVGGALSGGSTALSPESGPTTTGAGIGSLIADKVVPGSGALSGGLKGLMALIGAKGGQAIAGQDISMKPEDAIYPAAGALTSPITKGLNALGKYVHDSSPVTKSQALMDALKQKLSGGIAGNATQPLASEVTSGIRSDVNAANAKLAAAEKAPKLEKAALAEQVKGHENERDALKLKIQDEFRKLQPGEDPFLKNQAEAITKPLWKQHDAADALAKEKELAMKTASVKALDPKLAEQRLKDANIHDITNGRAVLDNLSKAKTGEEFNDLIYKGGKEYIQVAKRMIGNDPEKLEKLRVGFVSHVANEGYGKLTGQFSAKTVADRFDTEKGQTILKELYPDVSEINRKVADVKEVLKPGSPVLQWKSLGSIGGLSAATAIISLGMGHETQAMIEGGVAAASFAKIGAGELINKMLTNDKIRAGMLDYAKTGTVDNVSRAAANAFHAFLASHEVKKPSATPPIGQTIPNSLTPATTPPNPSSEIQSPPLSSSAPIR